MNGESPTKLSAEIEMSRGFDQIKLDRAERKHVPQNAVEGSLIFRKDDRVIRKIEEKA